MKQGKSYFLGLTLMLLVVSCGGGGGGGTTASDNASDQSSQPDSSSDTSTIPANESAILYGEAVTFAINVSGTVPRTELADIAGDTTTYNITVYYDRELTAPVAQVSGLVEGADGWVNWSPTVNLDGDRAYWWRWEVVTGSGIFSTSDLKKFYVTKKGSMAPVSPRNGGYRDINYTGTMKLAITNAFSANYVPTTFDFEIYTDAELTNLIASKYEVAQVDTATRTIADIGNVSFAQNSVYYWRARVVVNGHSGSWTPLSSFTAINPLDVSGIQYAKYIFETTRPNECDLVEYTDYTKALGPPDATGDSSVANPSYGGIVSLHPGGTLGVEMGNVVGDGGGADLRVYEYVSSEPLEVFVGATELGPWVSLGIQWCDAFCDFDLADAGLNYGLFIKIKDRWSKAASCHSTSGSDIDSLVVLNTSSSRSFSSTFPISSPSVGSGHSVPGWIKGNWWMVRLGFGQNVSDLDMELVITDSNFTYTYPGCEVGGIISMDRNLRPVVGNEYLLTMQSVNCSTVWGIQPFEGARDSGHIFSENNGDGFYRISDIYPQYLWIYLDRTKFSRQSLQRYKQTLRELIQRSSTKGESITP